MTSHEKNVPIVLKFDDWPEADQRAWRALVTPTGLFEDGGQCAHWSEGTRKIHMQAYGQWLSYLLRFHPDTVEQAPDERVARDTVYGLVEDARTRLAARSISNLVTGLTLVMTNAYLGDWDWLKSFLRRVQNEANTYELGPIPAPSADEIFQWSLKRMVEVEASGVSTQKKAIQFRQALMIGFLNSRPVRRRALLAMTVSEHVEWVSDCVILHFSKEDMKDAQRRSFTLPDKLVEPFQSYFEVHRPQLLGEKTGDRLWVNQYGNPITEHGLSRELPKITKRHLGEELRPHAFRHIAATSIAEYDPDHVGIIRDLLGHATMKTAERYYNRAGSISSCNGLQSIIEDIRKNVPTIGRAKRVMSADDDLPHL